LRILCFRYVYSWLAIPGQGGKENRWLGKRERRGRRPSAVSGLRGQSWNWFMANESSSQAFYQPPSQSQRSRSLSICLSLSISLSFYPSLSFTHSPSLSLPPSPAAWALDRLPLLLLSSGVFPHTLYKGIIL